MSNITVKVNLRQLKHVVTTTKKGNKCLILPIKENHFFEGEKGIYLDLQCFEIDQSKRKPDSKDTHLVKQSLPSEVYKSLSEDEKRAYPILGNATDWGQQPGTDSSSLNDSEISGNLEFDPEDLPF